MRIAFYSPTLWAVEWLVPKWKQPLFAIDRLSRDIRRGDDDLSVMRIERTLRSIGCFPCLCTVVVQTADHNRNILGFHVVLLGRIRCIHRILLQCIETLSAFLFHAAYFFTPKLVV